MRFITLGAIVHQTVRAADYIEASFKLVVKGHNLEGIKFTFDVDKLTGPVPETGSITEEEDNTVSVECGNLGSLKYLAFDEDDRKDPRPLMSVPQICHLMSILSSDLENGSDALENYLNEKLSQHLIEDKTMGFMVSSYSNKVNIQNTKEQDCVLWKVPVKHTPSSEQQQMVKVWNELKHEVPCHVDNVASDRVQIGVKPKPKGWMGRGQFYSYKRQIICSHNGQYLGEYLHSVPFDENASEAEKARAVEKSEPIALNEAAYYCSSLLKFIESEPVLTQLYFGSSDSSKKIIGSHIPSDPTQEETQASSPS